MEADQTAQAAACADAPAARALETNADASSAPASRVEDAATQEAPAAEGATPADEADAEAPASDVAGDDADAAAADVADSEEESEPTLEEQIERVRDTVNHNPRFREIHYHTLKFCLEERVLHDIEDMIAEQPEFASCDQNPYRLITYLENAGGLARIELDEDGNHVTPEMKEGLDEDEIDDLVVEYAFVDTEAGRAVYEEMRPRQRLGKLIGAFPKRIRGYMDVLDFCTEPRSWKEIDTLLQGNPVLKSGSMNPMTNNPLQPSVFIDQLERSGGIVWKNGSWNITEEGRRFLETMKAPDK